jgi:4-carboxymuconolactone decarboxylase
VKPSGCAAASPLLGDAESSTRVLNDVVISFDTGIATAGCTIMVSAEEAFRRLAIGDPALLAAAADPEGDLRVFRLDERTESLIRIAALVPIDAPQSSYHPAVEAAMRTGATLDDLLAALIAVAGSVGSPRVVSAAPRIALAAGYDVDAALETIEPVGR